MKQSTALGLLVVLIFCGFAIRLFELDRVPLRGDEAFTALSWSDIPIGESLTSIATIEPFPPLVYVVYRGWGVLFGIQSELLLRLFTVLANTIGIASVYALGNHLGGRRVGVFAAFLWTFHPFLIWHAQDYRTYALWVTLSTTAIWLGLRVTGYRRRVDWILYAFVTVVSAFIFYNELFIMIALSLYVLVVYRKDIRFLVSWIILQIVIAGSVLIGFFILQWETISSGVYGGTATRLELSEYFTRFLPELNFGTTLPLEINNMLWIVLLILTVISLYIIWRKQPRHALLLVILLLVPLILLGVASTLMSIFRPRYVLPLSTVFILIFSLATIYTSQRFASKRLQQMFPVFIGAIWLVTAGFSLSNYFLTTEYDKARDWRSFTDYLEENVSEGELIIPLGVDPAFAYYYEGIPCQSDIVDNTVSCDTSIPYSSVQPADEINALLATAQVDFDTVWIVSQAPDWGNYRLVEDWVNGQYQLARETEIDSLPIRQYKRWGVGDDEIDVSQSLTTFDDTIELVGVRIFENPEPTNELTIWLYWHPIDQTDKPYKVFAHLIGETNPETGSPLWSQDDQFPQDGRVSTDGWKTGEVYRDVFSIPLKDVSDGDYVINIGFYNPDNPDDLLPTEDESKHFTIGQIELK